MRAIWSNFFKRLLTLFVIPPSLCFSIDLCSEYRVKHVSQSQFCHVGKPCLQVNHKLSLEYFPLAHILTLWNYLKTNYLDWWMMNFLYCGTLMNSWKCRKSPWIYSEVLVARLLLSNRGFCLSKLWFFCLSFQSGGWNDSYKSELHWVHAILYQVKMLYR